MPMHCNPHSCMHTIRLGGLQLRTISQSEQCHLLCNYRVQNFIYLRGPQLHLSWYIANFFFIKAFLQLKKIFGMKPYKLAFASHFLNYTGYLSQAWVIHTWMERGMFSQNFTKICIHRWMIQHFEANGLNYMGDLIPEWSHLNGKIPVFTKVALWVFTVELFSISSI